MLPPHVSGATESAAERKLFVKIQQELGDDWSVLHSLGLATHDRKPWAEIDFVLVGPGGVYCLEVKGGRIARSSGQWTTTNRAGQINKLPQSPFAQVGGASAALRRFLAEQIPRSTSILSGFGVATPDVIFSISGADIIPEIVYDERDFSLSFSRFVDRLREYWQIRLAPTESEGALAANPNIVRSIVDALCRDFDLRPSLRSEVSRVQDELTRLTDRQAHVLRGLSDNPRVLVRGGAGTGKTMLAVAEAKRLAHTGQRVLLTCFNKLLAKYLAPIVDEFPTLTVRHIHGFMADVVDGAGRRSSLPDAAAEDLFEVFYPELCVEILLESGSPIFDAVFVDEGQDSLREAYLDVVDVALVGGLRNGTWRYFLDPNQDVYGGSGAPSMARLLSAAPAQFHLIDNCRNTVPIATNTALLSGMPLDEVLCDGPEVIRTYYDNPEQERHSVSKVLRGWLTQGVRPEEIVVLSPHVLARSCLARGLVGISAPLAEASSAPGPGSIRFSTVSGFKGLESTAVALIDIDDIESSAGAISAYVGASRAQALLSVSLSSSQRSAAERRAEDFGRLLVGRT
jgi:hypothetical protein